MQNPRFLPAALALLLAFVLLAGLAARYWASEKEYGFTGPTHIAYGAGSVFLFVSGDILQLESDGELIRVLPSSVTGLQSHPIDLAVMPGGALLIAEQAPAVIRICEVHPWSCRVLSPPHLSRIEKQFKVLAGKQKGRYFLTDAHGDMLWRFNEESGDLREMLPPKTLAGPNGLVFGEADTLWVADTDNQRIVELIPSSQENFFVAREHSAVNELTIGKRYFPMILDRTTDGRLWVAQAAEFSQAHSDLVVYDHDSGANTVIHLPADAYATAVAALPDRVLVTDLERFAVYSIDLQSYAVHEFGDPSFRQHLAALKQSRARYARLGTGLLIGVIGAAGLLILAALRATPKDRRWSKPSAVFDFENAPEKVPRIQGVHWLEKDSKSLRLFARVERSFYLLLAVIVLASLGLLGWLLTEAGQSACASMGITAVQLGMVVFAIVAIPVAIVPIVRSGAQAIGCAIGTDGRLVHLRLHDGSLHTVETHLLAYNQRVVLYRHHTFPLRAGQLRVLYAAGEVEKWLAPLLRRARPVNEWDVLKHQWKHRDRLLLWPLYSIFFLGCVMVAIKAVGL